MGVLQTPALPLGYVATRPGVTSIRPVEGGRRQVTKLVRRRRLELLRLAARPPQDRVSAYSTTSASAAAGFRPRTSISGVCAGPKRSAPWRRREGLRADELLGDAP